MKKKKVLFIAILFLVCALSAVAFVGCGDKTSQTDDSASDTVSFQDKSPLEQSGDSSGQSGDSSTEPEAISAKILVVSDVHISGDDNTKEHLRKTLSYAFENDIDAIIFNGDTVNLGMTEEYSHLDGVFEEIYGDVLASERPELIFNMGNHEFYPSDNCAHEETDYAREFGLFKTFAEKWGAAIEDNVFVRDVNGIKCVIAFPSDENSFIAENDIIIKSTGEKIKNAGETIYMAATGGYSENDVNKVKAKFDEILDSGYDKTIIFCTHHPLGETYGSTLYGMNEEAETLFKDMLKDYPSIVHLAGHTHFSSLHERSFVQNDWTSIQIGTHTYGKYVSGADSDELGRTLNYANITGKRYNSLDTDAQEYHGKTHFGMLLTFDSEKMTAERVYLSTGETYEHGSFEVPYGITKENKHDKFYYEAGERVGETLHFGEDTDLKAKIVNGEIVEVSFKDVDEYWACEGYEILIGDGEGNSLKRILWSSHFWMGLKEKSTYNIAVEGVEKKDSYTVRLRAIDFFGHYSEPYDEVEIQQSTESHPHKKTSESGADFREDASELKAYTSLTFYYKIVNGSEFSVAVVGDNWSTNYYGYMTFTANGAEGNYAGVTCVEQPDGYFFVTITFADVTKTNGSAPDKVKSFYIRGNYSNAQVYLDEIRFND